MAGARGVRLSIKVVPGSSRSGIAGWLGESLEVRVSEPAEGGRANAAVERTIAAALGVPVACARVVAGGGEGKVSQISAPPFPRIRSA